MKKICFAVFFLLCSSMVFAEVSVKMKDGKILTWQSYFEEDNSYCTWKSYGKFCVLQDDVKVIKETTGESSGNGSSGGSYAGDSGQTSTIIQRRGSGVIVDQNVSKSDREAEIQRLDREDAQRKWEYEKKIEKEKEDAKYIEEQRKKEAEERRYQQERDRRIKEDERKLYNKY